MNSNNRKHNTIRISPYRITRNVSDEQLNLKVKLKTERPDRRLREQLRIK